MNNRSPALRTAVFMVRTAAPIIWSVCLAAIRTMALAIFSLWSGVPDSLDRIANEWLDRATLRGWPTLYAPQLYYTFYAVAFVMFLIGWVLSAYLTVFIVALIF